MSDTFTAPPVAEDVMLEFELTVGDVRTAMVARGRAVRKARVMNGVLVAAVVLMAWGLTVDIARHGVGGVSPKNWGSQSSWSCSAPCRCSVSRRIWRAGGCGSTVGGG
ncbi:hypothetical protein GCM10020000_55860 [Streptomyces olivoverticillatus]